MWGWAANCQRYEELPWCSSRGPVNRGSRELRVSPARDGIATTIRQSSAMCVLLNRPRHPLEVVTNS